VPKQISVTQVMSCRARAARLLTASMTCREVHFLLEMLETTVEAVVSVISSSRGVKKPEAEGSLGHLEFLGKAGGRVGFSILQGSFLLILPAFGRRFQSRDAWW